MRNFYYGEGDCWNSENNPTIRVLNSSKAMKNRIFFPRIRLDQTFSKVPDKGQ